MKRLTILGIIACVGLLFAPAAVIGAGPPGGVDVKVTNTPLPVTGDLNATVTGSVNVQNTPNVFVTNDAVPVLTTSGELTELLHDEILGPGGVSNMIEVEDYSQVRIMLSTSPVASEPKVDAIVSSRVCCEALNYAWWFPLHHITVQTEEDYTAVYAIPGEFIKVYNKHQSAQMHVVVFGRR